MSEAIRGALPIDGWMFERELEWLAKQAQWRHRIAEVGCWKGRSTYVLAQNTPGVVWAIDHWLGPHDISNYADDYWEVVRGDDIYPQFYKNLKEYVDVDKVRVRRMSSTEAARHFYLCCMTFDMVFIDADHAYEYVRDDILAWRPLVEPGGLLCGHDINWPGVKRAVQELIPDYQCAGNIWLKIA